MTSCPWPQYKAYAGSQLVSMGSQLVSMGSQLVSMGSQLVSMVHGDKIISSKRACVCV